MEKILKVLNYQPAAIMDSDLANPLPAITHFFEGHPLDESKTRLRELIKGWLYTSTESYDDKELKNMVFFYEQLVEMINLCYVYTELEKQKNQT